MKIRRLKYDEIGVVSKIVEANYGKKFGKISHTEFEYMFGYDGDKPTYLVVESGSKYSEIPIAVAGYSVSPIDYSIYGIFWVNVHPDFQSQGIGTALVKEVVRRIWKLKTPEKAKIILLTAKKKSLYKHLGFKTILDIGEGESNLMALKRD